MKITKKYIEYPDDMDKECIKLCTVLNGLPGVDTVESCCGHLKEPYNIWFHCDKIDVISRLGRCLERNYSDGKWELVVDSCDVAPFGFFWLRSKKRFRTEKSMNKSVSSLIDSIYYWFDDRFDEYFENK